uniref:Uncharacterized protein n=1 Tax=Podoviridae sp. ctz6O13 TaxID=2827757 RepID=A0A8S5TK48_9CAUD|nr:MAG TPA: hypothetical protein [Podoviridae sp. ctz6O13]
MNPKCLAVLSTDDIVSPLSKDKEASVKLTS